MATITMPSAPIAAKIDWSSDQPAEVNRSEWTNARKVAILPAAPRWFADVSYPVIVGEHAFLPWRSFLKKVRGQGNAFHLIAVENVQISGVTPRINGAGQFGYSLASDGWGAAGLKLLDGMFVTINDQLLQLTADVVADTSGNATLNFEPWIRSIPADNTGIVADRPYALMSMSKGQNGYSVAPGQQYSVGFSCEEAV